MGRVLRIGKTNKPREAIYALTDHACRECGGRILRQLNVATAGSDCIYRCADCGKTLVTRNIKDLCWCDGEFICVNLATISMDEVTRRCVAMTGYKREIARVRHGDIVETVERRSPRDKPEDR